jgi:hypothetical protein
VARPSIQVLRAAHRAGKEPPTSGQDTEKFQASAWEALGSLRGAGLRIPARFPCTRSSIHLQGTGGWSRVEHLQGAAGKIWDIHPASQGHTGGTAGWKPGLDAVSWAGQRKRGWSAVSTLTVMRVRTGTTPVKYALPDSGTSHCVPVKPSLRRPQRALLPVPQPCVSSA